MPLFRLPPQRQDAVACPRLPAYLKRSVGIPRRPFPCLTGVSGGGNRRCSSTPLPNPARWPGCSTARAIKSRHRMNALLLELFSTRSSTSYLRRSAALRAPTHGDLRPALYALRDGSPACPRQKSRATTGPLRLQRPGRPLRACEWRTAS